MKGNKSIILYIDTSDSKKTSVTLTVAGVKISKIVENVRTSQMLLPLINQLLSENKLGPTDISAIEVHTGPGSFTGLRIGIAVANTLSYLLDIPVNGKKEKLVAPTY